MNEGRKRSMRTMTLSFLVNDSAVSAVDLSAAVRKKGSEYDVQSCPGYIGAAGLVLIVLWSKLAKIRLWLSYASFSSHL